MTSYVNISISHFISSSSKNDNNMKNTENSPNKNDFDKKNDPCSDERIKVWNIDTLTGLVDISKDGCLISRVFARLACGASDVFGAED